ncbi:acyltransferase [Halorhodospira abdelmalekii]|uniref:carbon-nitrogen hydrolase n=1 Tax=Halorhodospira abdelmalekii TaxID=421629 RepID=UPI0019064B75|nr:carbon-nitrogen hydrolase [Halorhodospira abdelmalekii]MBK1734596.1 acyltransferase [Halorhodospira abdelmalekii]
MALTLGLVQHACDDTTETNWQRTADGIAEAAARGAELILLQELHSGPYPCFEAHPRHFASAEPIPGPSTARLAELATRHNAVIVGSLFERRAAGLFHNTAVVLERDGRLLGCYRKMHIPDDPGYYEKFYFTPGDAGAAGHAGAGHARGKRQRGFVPIDSSVGRLGLLVCWDQWFPEAARLMALAGAELLLYPTAIGFDASEPANEQARQREAWQIVQRGHAIANGLPLAACNRSGHEAAARFWGRSFICGPQGEMLAEAGEEPAVIVAEVDLRRSEAVRCMWPFLRDRRIDAYADLSERFRDCGCGGGCGSGGGCSGD